MFQWPMEQPTKESTADVGTTLPTTVEDSSNETERQGKFDYFHRNENKECRTLDGKQGQEGKDFEQASVASHNECKLSCQNLDTCYGYEYTSSVNRCNVWISRLGWEATLQSKPGTDCYIGFAGAWDRGRCTPTAWKECVSLLIVDITQ